MVARCSTWPDKRKPEEGLEKSPHNRDIDHFVEEDTRLGPIGAAYVPFAKQCTCGTLILSICTQDPNQFMGLTAPALLDVSWDYLAVHSLLHERETRMGMVSSESHQ